MGTYGFDDDEAYRHVRKESMRKRISVEELSARHRRAADKTANGIRAPRR